MNILTIKRGNPYQYGNPYIDGHRYYDTWTLEVGWNRIKLNLTQNPNKKGYYVTWYPFSFYWWPSNNQWFRWRSQLGPRIRFHGGLPS
jgi:hypothetical protein